MGAQKFKAGDLIRRLTDDRLFRLKFVYTNVFSGVSADQYWSGCGGPIIMLHQGYELVEEPEEDG